ncbi:MAG: hypothetical protein ACOY5G_00015 [Pseudomonadota bacterium]
MHAAHPQLATPHSQFSNASTAHDATSFDAADQPVERLPFSVRLVSSIEDLMKAVHIRQAAYARHLPEFAKTLGLPESADYEDGVAILLAESHLDGSPLGTMRVQTNRFKPLTLEQSLELPDWLRHQTLAEATRLGVTNDKVGRLVTTVLFKAFFQYCLGTGVDWMVIAARAPVDRQYERLLFEDVCPGNGYIPLRHAGNLPHRVMSLNVHTAHTLWQAARHPLLPFICYTNHPDVQVQPATQDSGFGSLDSMPAMSFTQVRANASALAS